MSQNRSQPDMTDEFTAWLAARIRELAGLGNGDDIALDEPLASYGISSVDAVSLAGEISTRLGRKVPPTIAYEYPTLREILAYLRTAGTAQQITPDPRHRAPDNKNAAEPIAIVGLGCRFPGAANPDEFWALLEHGVDAVGQVPDDRFTRWGRSGSARARTGGFIPGIGGLDLDFFGMSEDEAAKLDPQQKLLLEVAFEALEDAGVAPFSLSGSRTGVFVGISSSDYRSIIAESHEADVYSLLGNASSIAANRLSYLLNLQGPSLAVDTACSSSLVAIHLARGAIARGECDLALVGGVNLILTPTVTEAFDTSGVLAPDGRCKAFSAHADGYVRSEGAGMVVLKPLSAALRNGDRISAVILGSAVTSDGRTNGMVAPSRHAQESVISRALDDAGIQPADVAYVEAHGTGTAIGDQIEALALGNALGRGRDQDRPCAIGSVKTNIGHLEAAAGIAGLIKVALSVERKMLPPSLHCAEPHPDIEFEKLGLVLQSAATQWNLDDGAAAAGVSSFGFGGTNAHVVVGPAPKQHPAATTDHPAHVLALTAHTEAALRQQAGSFIAWAGRLDDRELRHGTAAATMLRGARGSRNQNFRAAVTFAGKEELIAKLQNPFPVERINAAKPGVVFVFPGQGAQWAGMGRALLEAEPAFELAISRCEDAFAPYISWSLRDALTEDHEHLLDRIDVVQPVLFAMQVGLAAVFGSWGVQAAGVIGHSMGEIAASYVAGALRLEDAARVICRRSAMMMRHRGQGAMALVSLPPTQVREALSAYGDKISLAAHNGPSTCVVSGENAAVQNFIAEMQTRDVFCRPVNVDVASHCALLQDLNQDLLDEFEDLSPRSSRLPFYSALHGKLFDTTDLDAEYWWRNLREPVLFADAVHSAGSDGHQIFLEVSPHPLVTVAITECFEESGQSACVVPAMRRHETDSPYEALASLFRDGLDVDWGKFYSGATPQLSPRLPTYPWQRQQHWINPVSSQSHEILVTGAMPVIRDHQVKGRAIAPGAWMIDAALHEVNRDATAAPCGLSDVFVTSSLAVAHDESKLVRVCRRVRPDGELFLTVESREAATHDSPWQEHLCAAAAPLSPAGPVDLPQIRRRCAQQTPAAALYDHLSASGLTYGPTMQMVQSMWVGDNEVLTELAAPSERTAGRWLPADVADGAMQSIAALTLGIAATETFVGFGYRQVNVFAKLTGPTFAHARLRGALVDDADSFDCDVNILDAQGRILVQFECVSLKRIRTRHTMKFFAVEPRTRPLSITNASPPAQAMILSNNDIESGPIAEQLHQGGISCTVSAIPHDQESLAFLDSLPASVPVLCAWPQREEFLGLLQQLAAAQGAPRRELVLVTHDAALPPLLRALEQETMSWSGRAILVDAATMGAREAATNIAAEIASPASSFVVHYRNGERVVPTLADLNIDSGTDIDIDATQLKPAGVYWITGGQGGIGAVLAQALAVEVAARVVITGRRARVDQDLIDTVEAAGGQLLYIQADVTDQAAMRGAFAEIINRYGALHGVIHTAGILEDALLTSASTELLRKVMEVKETGARILLETVASEEVDFVVLFSSLASLFVMPGQGCYAAANAALDALASPGNKQNTKIRSINWGPWAEVGMVADDRYQRQFLETGVHPISPEAGAKAFFQALASPHQQLAVVDLLDSVVGDYVSQFNQGHGAPKAPRRRAAHQTDAGGSVTEFLQGEMARALRCAAAEVDTSTRFDQLGVDSLLAVSLTKRIGAHYGLELPSTFMFHHQTVGAVALYIEDVLGAGGLTEPAAVPAQDYLLTPSEQDIVIDEEQRHSSVTGHVVTTTHSGIEMSMKTVPVRKPGADEVVIDVHAVGVNFIDVLATSGFHPFLTNPPFVPGHEVAGVVCEVGEGVHHVKPGDAVFALTPQGGYASRVTTAAFTAVPLPSGISFTDAVSMLISGLTAIACLEQQAVVRPGDHVLIQAAAGATGTACAQLALHHGAVVYGTASTPAKLEHLTALGVQHPINYVEHDFADAVRAVGPPRGLDLIVDSLSGDVVRRGLQLLRPGGRFIEIGAAGVLDLPVDGHTLFMSSQSFCTVNVGVLAQDPETLQGMLQRLTQLIEAGVFRPAVGGVFPLEDAAQAIKQLRNRENIGKYVLSTREGAINV